MLFSLTDALPSASSPRPAGSPIPVQLSDELRHRLVGAALRTGLAPSELIAKSVGKYLKALEVRFAEADAAQQRATARPPDGSGGPGLPADRVGSPSHPEASDVVAECEGSESFGGPEGPDRLGMFFAKLSPQELRERTHSGSLPPVSVAPRRG